LRISTTTQPPTIENKNTKKKNSWQKCGGGEKLGLPQAKRKVSSKQTLSLSFSFYREGGEVVPVLGDILLYNEAKYKGHMMFFCFCFCCFFFFVLVS